MKRVLLALLLFSSAVLPRMSLGETFEDLFQRIDEMEDPKRKVEALSRLIAAGDASLKVLYYRRGWAKKEARDYEGAAADFEAALAIDEHFHWARNAAAWTYCYNLGELEVAAAEFLRIIRDEEASFRVRASAYGGLAEIFRVLREMETSITLHERGIAVRPTCLGYHNLAWLYNTHRRDFKKAVALCEKALELDPEYEYGRVSLAVFLANDGHTKRAREIIAAVDRTEPVRHYNLACYYAVTGDREEALRYIESYLRDYCTAARRRDQTRRYMLRDWHLDSLKNDPRFISLMKKEGAKEPGEGEKRPPPTEESPLPAL